MTISSKTKGVPLSFLTFFFNLTDYFLDESQIWRVWISINIYIAYFIYLPSYKTLMRSRPVADRLVKVQRLRRFRLRRFLQGLRSRGKDASSCVGGVCGGGINHQFKFALQPDQTCQNVIQQYSYSPLQIRCWEIARAKMEEKIREMS